MGYVIGAFVLLIAVPTLAVYMLWGSNEVDDTDEDDDDCDVDELYTVYGGSD